MLSNLLAFHLFFTSVLLIFVGAYSWRQRGFSAATPFSVAMLFCALFTFISGLDILTSSLETKILWMRLRASSLPFIPVTILITAIMQARRTSWLSRNRILALLIIPTLNLLFVWVPTLGVFFRYNFQLTYNSFAPVLTYTNGPWLWVILIYSGLISVSIFGIEFNILLNSQGIYFKQTTLLAIGQIIPAFFIILLAAGKLNFFSNYNYTPHLLMLTAILNGWAIYRYQWLLATPIARDIATDQISDIMLVVDENNRIVDLNQAARLAFDVSENIIGAQISKIIQRWSEIHDDVYTKGILRREIVIEKNEEPRIYELIINPQSNATQEASTVVLVLREFTQFKQQQQQINQLALAVEQSPNSVLITDTEGIIQYVNPAFSILTGYESDEVIGKKTNILKSTQTPANVYEHMWKTIKAGRIWKSDLLNQRKNGELYWEETLIAPLFDTKGNVINYISIKEDITARKEIDEILHRRLEELMMVNTISMAAAAQLDLTSLVSLVGQQLEQSFNARSVFIAIHDRHTNLIDIPYWTIDKKRVTPPQAKYGEGLTSHILKTGQHLLISTDFQKQALSLGHKPIFANEFGYPKTWLGVPIKTGQQAIGVISLQNYEIEFAFNEDDVRLLTTIAANIGVAIENAHLFQDAQKEIDERIRAEKEASQRAEQMAVIYESGQAVTAGLNLELVLNTLMQKCQQIATVDVFTVAHYDSHTQQVKFIKFHDNGKERQHIAINLKTCDSITKEIIINRLPISVPDIKKQPDKPRYKFNHTSPRHARCYLGMPLLRGEEVIGVMSVQSYQPNAYSKEQIQTLEIIASQAASAIENARLFEETRQRADEMSLLYEASLELSANLDLNQVLRNLLEKCRQILPMDSFFVALYDETNHLIYHPLFFDNGEFKTIAVRDIRVTPGLTGEIILSGKSIYLADTTNPDIMQKYQIVHIGGTPTRCFVGIPMIVRDKVIGVISMQTYKPDSYSTEQIRLIETIATQAAIAIENSRLYEDARKEINERRRDQETLQQTNQELQVQLNRVESIQGELREQAIRDSLTGLYNRRYLDEIFKQKISQMRRKTSSLSVLMLDIDHFKIFNDTHGHQAGDELLKMLGKLLRKYTRSSDVACRYGGEEFVILLADTNLDISNKRANEIRIAFEKQGIVYGDQTLSATISIGIAAYPEHGDSPEELLIQADQALYSAKAAGRNCVITWKR